MSQLFVLAARPEFINYKKFFEKTSKKRERNQWFITLIRKEY